MPLAPVFCDTRETVWSSHFPHCHLGKLAPFTFPEEVVDGARPDTAGCQLIRSTALPIPSDTGYRDWLLADGIFSSCACRFELTRPGRLVPRKPS